MIYTYAVVRPRATWDAPLPEAGIAPGAPVTLVRHGDLAAAVSAVPAAEFSADALEARLQDAAWLHARVLCHQQTLAGLMGGYTVLPLKFCTLFADVQRVGGLLESRGPALAAALDRLAGAAEWGVKLYCDRRALARWAAEASPEVAPLREQVAKASAGAAYMLAKKLERVAEQTADRALNLAIQGTHQRLAGRARAAATSAPQPPQAHRRPAEMALNGAYLVPDDALDAFRDELADLERAFAGRGFSYELTGPWPPYNFAAIEG